jgi:hypothetical protein
MTTSMTMAAAIATAATSFPSGEPIADVLHPFDTDEDLAAWTVSAEGEAAKRMPQPKIESGGLYLLESWWKSSAVAAGPAPTDALAGTVEASWTLTMNTGTEGAGFVWLDVAAHGADGAAIVVEAWEAPDVPGCFGLGFDASDPPNRDPFRGSGNVYDRPQHEVSLHWDGIEIVKRMTPMDFRDEKPHAVRLRLAFLPGGAEVSLWIDDQAMFDRYFIASMTAYVGRPAFGARNTETAGDVLVDDLRIVCADPIEPPAPPLRIVAIDRQLNDNKHKRNEATVAFPEETDEFARIICTLRLDQPETRFDPWDRIAHVFVFDDEKDGDAAGERFEILRYITPYHRGHAWKVDVTDFRPLLRGERRVRQVCGTQGEGWVVSVIFDFYPGATDRRATRVINLWSGSPEIGNPGKPVEAFYVPREVPLGDEIAFAKVRTVVTGHGMAPNTNNAGEFMPISRTLTVNGEAFTNRLWKDDNYLNPCRPQGGTWKYDRAGWAPGDVVRPWEVDATPLLGDGPDRVLRIEYALDPYVNENRGKTWAPSHVTEAQVILYERAAR